MSTEKLNELKEALEFLETTPFCGEWYSALVGGENGKNYHAVTNADDVVVRASDDSRHTSWLCDYLEVVSPVNIRAMLEELEAKDKRIAELERANKSQDDHINKQQDRIESLEKKNGDLGRALFAAEKRLAMPVRLSCETHPRCRTLHAADVRAAGFKVEGDA